MSEIAKVLPYCIDLDKPLEKTELHTLFLMGDQNAHRIELEITRGGQEESLEGCTVAGYFVCLSSDVTIKLDGTVENEKAVVTLSKQCYTNHGQFALIIQIESGDVTASVFNGEGFMRRSTTETIIYDDYIIYDVSTLLGQIAAMKAATQEANAAAEAAHAVIEDTNAAKDAANTAAQNAGTAAETANAAAGKVDGMTIDATALDTAQQPTASVETVDGHLAIHLGLPRGMTGATPQITFEVATGEPGTDASVTVSGTEEAPHLLLTIPRGYTGSIGSLTINGKSPGSDGSVTLTAEDIGARPETWMPTADDVGARPIGWMPSATDVGARPETWMPTAQDVGAVSLTKVWANASPGSSMAADQTGDPDGILIDWTGIDAICIVYAWSASESSPHLMSQTATVKVGNRIFLNGASGQSAKRASRVLVFTETGLRISGALTYTGSQVADDSYMIPMTVYAIKGVLSND